MSDPVALAAAKRRLSTWTDPGASGNPAKRAQQIWPLGLASMAMDIRLVLAAI